MEERLARFAGARDAVEPSRRSQSFDRSVTLKDRMKAFQNSPAATPPAAELDRTATIKDRMKAFGGAEKSSTPPRLSAHEAEKTGTPARRPSLQNTNMSMAERMNAYRAREAGAAAAPPAAAPPKAVAPPKPAAPPAEAPPPPRKVSEGAAGATNMAARMTAFQRAAAETESRPAAASIDDDDGRSAIKGKLGALKDAYAQSAAATAETRSVTPPPEDDGRDAVRGKLGALKDAYAQSLVADAEARPKSESSADDDGRDAAKGKREAMKKAYAESVAATSTAPAAAEIDLEATLARAEKSDATLTAIELSGSAEFNWLAPAAKSVAIGRIARSTAVRSVKLERLHLDDSHAPAVATMLKCMPQLEELSVERNEMHEPGLIALAEAVEEHPAIANLSVGNQLAKLSTVAIGRLIDAQERTPSLLHLHLGQLRDPTQITRLEMVSVANIEKARLAKLSQSSRDSPGVAGSRRRSQSFDRVQPKLGQIADWAREARRIRGVDTSAFEYSMGLPGSPRGGQRGDVSTYVTTGSALWMRANAEERLKLIEAFAATSERTRKIETVEMVDCEGPPTYEVNCNIVDKEAEAWAEVLSTNTTITSLNLESNSIATSGIEALAAAIAKNGKALRELKLANQHLAFSQAAEEALAASLEKNETLIKLTIELRSTRAREAINKALTRNQDKRRKARVAAGGADTRKVAGVNVADWAAEAERVASSSPPYAFGRPTGQLPKGVAADACYSLTGEALWGRAKPEERLALVRAFASNAHVVCFELANAGAPDAIAEAFGDALKSNSTLTSLNLESNAIGTAGVKALASGVKANTSLRELKLANQKGASATQAAEEELAAAVSSHPKLTKLTLDAKSTRARDTIEKALRANQDRARQERRTSVPKINLTSPLKALSAKRLSRTSKTAGGEDSAPRSARKGSTIGNLLRKASLMSSSGGAASPRGARKGSVLDRIGAALSPRGTSNASRADGSAASAASGGGGGESPRKGSVFSIKDRMKLLQKGGGVPTPKAAPSSAPTSKVSVPAGLRSMVLTPPGSAPVSGRSPAPSTEGGGGGEPVALEHVNLQRAAAPKRRPRKARGVS